MSQYSQESTCFRVVFLISCQPIKKETPTQVSSYEYFKIFKNTQFQEYVRTAVSVLLNILIFFFLKNEKMANRKLGKAGNLGNLGNIIPSFRFGPTAKIENSDLKFLEKNFRDFQDFRGFRVFDLALEGIMKQCDYLGILLVYFQKQFRRKQVFLKISQN